MEVEIVHITRVDWDALVAFDANRPVSRLLGSCHTTHSPMAPTTALNLPLSHLHASLMVRAVSASTLLSLEVLVHPILDYFILTASIQQWEIALVRSLRLEADDEARELASRIWLLLEYAGFREVFNKYSKIIHPVTGFSV